MINTSVSALRSDMTKELSRVDSKMKELREKISTLEAQNDTVTTEHQPSVSTPRSEFDTERNLCFKNVVEEDVNDCTEKLNLYVNNILSDLDINVNVVAVKRIGQRKPNNDDTSQQWIRH